MKSAGVSNESFLASTDIREPTVALDVSFANRIHVRIGFGDVRDSSENFVSSKFSLLLLFLETVTRKLPLSFRFDEKRGCFKYSSRSYEGDKNRVRVALRLHETRQSNV